MTPQDTMRLALRALETGLELAEAHAEHTHTVYAGYYPERHKQVDTEVAEIKAAIEALREALAQQPKFTNDLVEFIADALTVDKDHARALMSQALSQQGEQPVAWRYKKEGGGWFVSDNEPQYVEQWNDIEEIQPLYAGAAPAAHPDLPQKARPDFIAGYDAGMADAKRMALAQQGEQPVAWVDMENGVPVERPRLWQDNTHGEVALYAAAPAAQPDTWTDDGGWTFPVERQIIQTR